MARTISDEEQRLLALIEAAWAAATGGRPALARFTRETFLPGVSSSG